VERFRDLFVQPGWSVWWDADIVPGETWDDVIEDALAAATCVVVLWSQESVKRKWVKVEATEGERRGILVPVLMEDVRLPPASEDVLEDNNLVDWETQGESQV